MKLILRILAVVTSLLLIFTVPLGCRKKKFTNKIDGYEFLFSIDCEKEFGIEKEMCFEGNKSLYDDENGLVGETITLDLFGRNIPVVIADTRRSYGDFVTKLCGEYCVKNKKYDLFFLDENTMEILSAELRYGDYEPFTDRITSEEELLSAAERFMESRGVDVAGFNVEYYLTSVRDIFDYYFCFHNGLRSNPPVEQFEELDDHLGYRVVFRQYVSGIPTGLIYRVAFRCDGTIFFFDTAPSGENGKYPEISVDMQSYKAALDKLIKSFPSIGVYLDDEQLDYKIYITRDKDCNPVIEFYVQNFSFYRSYLDKLKGEKSRALTLEINTPIEISE